MKSTVKGSVPPKAREAARAGATSQNSVVIGLGSREEGSRYGHTGQAVADLIRAAREAARDALVRGLSSEGADAHAALSLGRHHARRAERLAIFAEAGR